MPWDRDGGARDHPGQGEIDARYDELALVLAQYSQAPIDSRAGSSRSTQPICPVYTPPPQSRTSS
ncbi:hypothetical protein GCM10010282_30940 [Streptomyces roseolus]|nr:hypothetical protein GCM10010282_30940 [Streptomyces roseolus]